MLQDSLRNLERCQARVDSVVKNLAAKVIGGDASYEEEGQSYASALDLDDIPQIEIGKTTADTKWDVLGGLDYGTKNCSNLLIADRVMTGGGGDTQSMLSSNYSMNKFMASSSNDNLAADIKVSIETASQSLFNLKEMGSKYGVEGTVPAPLARTPSQIKRRAGRQLSTVASITGNAERFC